MTPVTKVAKVEKPLTSLFQKLTIKERGSHFSTFGTFPTCRGGTR